MGNPVFWLTADDRELGNPVFWLTAADRVWYSLVLWTADDRVWGTPCSG